MSLITRPELYLQARDRIAELMAPLGPGGQLPSEADLARRLGVSRNTVRDALTRLERDGLVVRLHGRGTFVAPGQAHLGARLNEMVPIPDLIRAAGYAPVLRDLVIDSQPVAPEVAAALGAMPGEALPAVRMLYLADARPAIVITYVLAPAVAEAARDWGDFDGSMVAFVEGQGGVRIHQSVTRLRAVAASSEVAAQLGLDEGEAVLEFVSVAYTVDGQPLYHSVSYQDSRLIEVSVVRSRK